MSGRPSRHTAFGLMRRLIANSRSRLPAHDSAQNIHDMRETGASFSDILDKLVTSSRLAVATPCRQSTHGCDARIPKEGTDMGCREYRLPVLVAWNHGSGRRR